MQNKLKLNLYDIEVSKNSNRIFSDRKSVAKVKLFLFSVLAVSVFISIGQSLSLMSSNKTTFADFTVQNNIISSSSYSKIAK